MAHDGEGTLETGDHGFNEFATATSAVLRARVTGDTQDRLVIRTDGAILTGAGSAAPTTGAVAGGTKPTAAKVETIGRSQVTAATIVGAATGIMQVAGINLAAGTVVTNIAFLSGTTALATPTHGFVALYDPTGALLAQSTDNITFAVAASTLVTTALASVVTTTVSGLHYIAIGLTATTMPTYSGSANTAAVNTLVPILAGTSGSAVGATAPATLGTITPAVGLVYAYVS